MAVVGDNGKLVDNISSHDMRTLIMDADKFPLLCHMIGEKEGKLHAKHALTCHPSDSLASVIQKLSASHVHRLYVVDSHHRPVGVVSMRDVIARFVREPQESQLWKFFAEASQ